MGDFIEGTRHLTPLPEHDRLMRTFIGQAHIAGTGPAGKTCRECALWGLKKHTDGQWFITPPGHFSASSKVCPGALKRGKCNYEIRGKSGRRIPHIAPACRFFQQAENPPLPMKCSDDTKEAKP